MKSEDIAKLLLRVAVGGLMLFHGVNKLRHGIGGISTSVASHGWPSFVGYGVYIGEVIAPVAVVLGFFCRSSPSSRCGNEW